MTDYISIIPNEILYKVLSGLSPFDLSRVRNVSKKFRYMSDHPAHWKSIILDPKDDRRHDASLFLWNQKDLKNILHPHLAIIEKIHICGVRDNVIQYLLLECSNLRELTICGWLTLSEHSFRIPLEKKKTPLLLRSLRLIGDTQQLTNFISLDSTTLGQLITKCPYLEELSVNCEVHFQAEGLLKSLKMATSLALKTLVIATKRTWASQHITELFEYCKHLEFLGLMPDGASIGHVNEQKTYFSAETLLKAVLSNTQKESADRASEKVLLEKHSLPVEEEEMEAFHNIAIFSGL